MAGCLAARTAMSREHEPSPCFAWGDPYVIAPVRTLFPRGWCERYALTNSQHSQSSCNRVIRITSATRGVNREKNCQ